MNVDLTEAMARAKAWRSNPKMRPEPRTARAVAAALADRITQLEGQLATAQRLAAGREVLLLRGNPARGPETGAGFGRKVPAVVVEASVGHHQVLCRLLADDHDAVGSPCRAGDEGLWAASQVIVA